MTNMLDATDVRILPMWLACRFDVPKALLLKQAHWSMTNEYTRVQWRDRWWFKRSMDAWHHSLPCYGKRTLERHLADLEDMGLILSTTELNKIDRPEVTDGYYQFDPTKWYTVVMEHERINVDPSGPQQIAVDDNLTDPPAKMADTVEAPATIAESPAIIAGSTAKVADASSINELKNKGTSVFQTETVIEKHLGKKEDRTEALKKANDRPDHGPTLSDYWRGTLSHYGHAASTQSEMTAAEVGMLKTLVKALPSVDYLDDVLKHWPKFQNFAREEYDVKLPARPRVKNLAGIRDVIAEFQTQSNQLDEDLTLPDGTVVGSDDWQDDWVPPD